jgi:hypothetical protein
VDRARTPFLLLGLHRPLYTSTADGVKAKETKPMREVSASSAGAWGRLCASARGERQSVCRWHCCAYR